MTMQYSFPHYLLAKQSVDDRALNQHVLASLKANLPGESILITEVGAGIGTMITRLLRWDVLRRAEYVLVDQQPENIEFAREWIPSWAGAAGMSVEKIDEDRLRVFDAIRDVRIHFERAEIFDFIQRGPVAADLLIAHAFLDLLPLPESLPKILSLTKGLAWLTINFDGLTALEPEVDAGLDQQIELLYHSTMDTRSTGGDSRTGRHLFRLLRSAGAQILAAGSSDWVVHPSNGKYPLDEAYFLHFILHFYEESLAGKPALDANAFSDWLKSRRNQIEQGELVLIAHQMDFLARI